MVERIFADDVLPAHPKIKGKIRHCELPVESAKFKPFFVISKPERFMWALIYNPLVYCYIFWGSTAVVKPHPIHVSTTNIEYNKQDSKVEVICTIFTDDFEAALVKQYGKKTDLNKADMHNAMDEMVKNYIYSHLQLKDPGILKLNYLGFEINKEATDVYLESDKTPVFKKIDIDDSLLYNLFDDQINIVHVIVNGVRKSEKLDYPNMKLSQEF